MTTRPQGITLPSSTYINVKDAPYRAQGDGTTDDRAAIQAAITAANAQGGGVVFIPVGTYRLSPVNYISDDGSTISGITSLKLLDGVKLCGEGQSSILKVTSGAYGLGAFYRCISSRDITRLSNAEISDLTVDGNTSGNVASTQCSNIVLECLANVTVRNVKSLDANGNGIMLRGTTAGLATDLAILDCTVTGATAIGIQASQFAGLVICGNQISGTSDNCIDVYGEDGTTAPHARQFSITGNTCSSGLVGIFLETVANGAVAANDVTACAIGITVNRINGQPNGLNIHGNTVYGCAIGSRITGDTGGVSLYSNSFMGYSIAGVQIGGTGGNCSYVSVNHNFFTPANGTTPTILTQGNTISFCSGKFNTVNYNGITLAYLALKTATTHVNVTIDSFKVLPNQVGRDVYGYDAEFLSATLLSASYDNVAGPLTFTPTDNTGGLLIVTGRRTVTGESSWTIPYTKYSGTLVLGTPLKAIVTADPISGITVSGAGISIALVGSASYVRVGVLITPVV